MLCKNVKYLRKLYENFCKWLIIKMVMEKRIELIEEKLDYIYKMINESSKKIDEFNDFASKVNSLLTNNVSFMKKMNKNIDVMDENFLDVYSKIESIKKEIKSLKS